MEQMGGVTNPNDVGQRRDAFLPAALGPISLRNRFLKAATFEGMAVDNLVTDRLVDFHRTVAAGGVGMTTVSYLAVSADGQGAPAEIVVRGEAVAGLRHLADAVHAEGSAVSAQIGHAGPVAAGTGHTGLAPSRIFSPLAMKFTKAVTEDDISRITADLRNAVPCLATVLFLPMGAERPSLDGRLSIPRLGSSTGTCSSIRIPARALTSCAYSRCGRLLLRSSFVFRRPPGGSSACPSCARSTAVGRR